MITTNLEWTELFSSSQAESTEQGARIPVSLACGDRVVMQVRPMMHFRPTSIAISTNRNACLECELVIINRIYPLGYCDLWPRSRCQKLSAFIHSIENCYNVGPGNTAQLRIRNRGRSDVFVLAQLNGRTAERTES